MIKYKIGTALYNVEGINFPAGEVGVKLTSRANTSHMAPPDEIILEAYLTDNNEIMKMLLTVDALRREHVNCRISAFIPYVPYARQDRVCVQGEALSAYTMAQLINICGFTSVQIADPHSDVIAALIDRSTILSQIDIFSRVHKNWNNIHIVAPDNGAYKKATAFAKAVDAAGVIVCNKLRNLADGKIIKLTMSDDVTGLNLFILDDICDGGRTFIELAKLTKAAARVELAVTHGLFTKGVDVVANEFHHVYTTNSYTGSGASAIYNNTVENFTIRLL